MRAEIVRRPVPALEARESRGVIEAALDAAAWPWSPRLSLWLDTLLMLEETE